MIRPPFPMSPYPPIMLPDPEVLPKYGVIAARVLRMAKNKAKLKGKEHKQVLKDLDW